jgi:hypothetical protein
MFCDRTCVRAFWKLYRASSCETDTGSICHARNQERFLDSLDGRGYILRRALNVLSIDHTIVGKRVDQYPARLIEPLSYADEISGKIEIKTVVFP